MTLLPTISIVVPSYNQAQYLSETLQSLLDQEYPSLEVIIQDGGSSDGSINIAEEFVKNDPSVFQLFVEKDSGQADALNRGFARATGDILAFLNSDDTYFPKILHRVALEINPDKDRFIIMGRCIFTGEGSVYVGIEHPSEYKNHFEHLAIWKRGFNTVPQPSVFWHKTVWERCGGFDTTEQHALDYDLFCRFSRHYTFHKIDELFSTYRMHENSKTSQKSEAEVLELAIQVSRKHWGSKFSLLYWCCKFSYWMYRLQRHEKARHHARRAEEAFSNHNYVSALIAFVQTLAASPQMAKYRLLYGWLLAKGVRLFETTAISNLGFTGCYADEWIGPIYQEILHIPEKGSQIIISASHFPQPTHKKVKVRLYINGKKMAAKVIKKETTFLMAADVTPYRNQDVLLDIRTNSFFIPSDKDDRKLALKLRSVTIKN